MSSVGVVWSGVGVAWAGGGVSGGGVGVSVSGWGLTSKEVWNDREVGWKGSKGALEQH